VSGALAPAPLRAAVGRRVWQGVFHGFYRSTTIDGHRVPETGPVLLASNHTGLIDGPLVFGLAPRPAHFVVKQEMFHGISAGCCTRWGRSRSTGRRPTARPSPRRLRCWRVGEWSGSSPRAAAVAETSPRARRRHVPRHGQRRSDRPVGLPRHQAGGHQHQPPAVPGRRLAVVFGDPLRLEAPPELPRREASKLLTEQVRSALAAHVRVSAARTGIPIYDSGFEDAS
jgi:1-acyl-sn-glycerol-3-phosphate acyltransferase